MEISVQHSAFCALLLFSLFLQTCQLHGASTFSCRADEREALLQFKGSLKDPHGLLSSWVGHDCCSWRGIECSNITGNVIRLELKDNFEGDEISPSLLSLLELSYLDLSGNDFNGAAIPKFIGSFNKLRHLDLSYAGFVGMVPPELGNLSRLRYLDLSRNHIEDGDGSWLSRLSSLQYLYLDFVVIKDASAVLESLGTLPSLSELHLSRSLASVPGALPRASFTSLRLLDLSANDLNATMPSWLFEIVSLTHLDLSSNNFTGHVPMALSNLTSLEVLDMSNNEFLGGTLDAATAIGRLSNLRILRWSGCYVEGQLPLWLANLKKLQTLDLSYNLLSGTLLGLGQLSALVKLDLTTNYFYDVLTDAHFENLTRLEYLILPNNNITLRIGPRACPQLKQIHLDNCPVGPSFPAWLRTMNNMSFLSLSSVGISDVMPDWFWNFSPNIKSIDLSNNMIRGKLPASFLHLTRLWFLNLMNNQFEGSFPQFSRNLRILLLNNNLIYGSVPSYIGDALSDMIALDASANKLGGSIPTSTCKMKALQILILSNNQLSGVVPDCWSSINQDLHTIDLGNNILSGGIPASIGFIPNLESLHLESNNLSGGLPSSLVNCTTLKTLDLGHNKLNGQIPTWLGGNFEFNNGGVTPNCEDHGSLHTLSLRSNMFVGQIPGGLGNLPCLKVLDLSHNMLSGSIPQSFANFSAMKSSYGDEDDSEHIDYEYAFMVNNTLVAFYDNVDIVTKGRDESYENLLRWLASIDLSSNNLSGEIPQGLATLSRLQNLNLSRNHLTGSIPRNVTGFQHLESLDLSYNNLTGEIPLSMADLNSLGVMNFSFNNLSGKIPTGGPFESHPDASIYTGNSYLCGFPLRSPCGSSVLSRAPQSNNGGQGNKKETDDEKVWFYISMAPGFVIGFWTFVGALLLKKKWRFTYYRCIDQAYDKLYVFMKVNLARHP